MGVRRIKSGTIFVRPAVGLKLILSSILYSGLKKGNVGQKLSFSLTLSLLFNLIFAINLRFDNTAALKSMKGGAKFVTPAVRLINTAGVRRMNCGAKFV